MTDAFGHATKGKSNTSTPMNNMTTTAMVLWIVCAGIGATDELSRGEKLYNLHCAACHGQDGRGGGPIASALKTPPSDLTQLSSANEGVFPTERMIGLIHGTEALPEHGGTMPVFGYFFKGPKQEVPISGQPSVTTSTHVAALITWLERLQP